MFVRILSLAGGLAGALALSQAPEFSQQYLQRLAGQVDALAAEVLAFDTDAAEAGLSRDEAMDELAGSTFLDARQQSAERLFARFERLAADLAALRAASPVERIFMPHRLADRELLAATWSDYAPAVPTTAAGALSAGLGGLGGMLGLGAVAGLISLPFRRRARRAGTSAARRQPGPRPAQVARVEPVPPAHVLPEPPRPTGAPPLPGARRA